MEETPNLSYEGDSDSGVGTDESHKNLSSDVPKKILNVLSDEVILHDGLPARRSIWFVSH